MKAFLTNIKKESNTYKDDALRIESIHKNLKYEYRDLQDIAQKQVFRPERVKSPNSMRKTLPLEARSGRAKSPQRFFSKDFWYLHEKPRKTGSPRVSINSMRGNTLQHSSPVFQGSPLSNKKYSELPIVPATPPSK